MRFSAPRVPRLAVFRRDELREVEVVLDRRPRDKVEVVPAESPGPAAQRAYKEWLGEDIAVVR